MNVGQSYVLYPIEDQLLCYIFKLRECGMAVTSRSVMIKAAALSREYRARMSTAQYAIIHQFIAHHGLVHPMGTRISQWHPRELEVIATHFMESVCPMVVGIHRDQDFIINMDQSPILFTFDRQRTLEVAGVCAVCIRKSTCDTKQATLAITITASGSMLTPVLVFKGAPEGCIATWDFRAYACRCIYACLIRLLLIT